MDFGIGDIIALGGSAISGGILGVVGVAVKGAFAWLNTKAELNKLAVTNEHELALLREQRLTKAQDDAKEEQIAAEATRQASYGFANVASAVSTWVSNVVSLMRPAITVYLLALSTMLVVKVLYGAPLPYVDSAGLVKEAINSVTFLTSTSVTWWFGDRPPQKR